MAPGSHKHDFSDTDTLHRWYSDHIWTGNPKNWSPDKRRRVAIESLDVRRELDRRIFGLTKPKLDGSLFWSGIVLSFAGATLLVFPPAAVPILVGTGSTIAGLGATLGGAIRTQFVNEQQRQLKERSLELNRLQRELAV